MSILHLPVKREYFDSIKSGSKTDEYRLVTPYWAKRLVGREYSHVHITLGYPKSGDMERTLIFQFTGYREATITHPHFGPDPVAVYAIRLQDEQDDACNSCAGTGEGSHEGANCAVCKGTGEAK